VRLLRDYRIVQRTWGCLSGFESEEAEVEMESARPRDCAGESRRRTESKEVEGEVVVVAQRCILGGPEGVRVSHSQVFEERGANT
jgi:hypothetical protein